MTRLQRYFYVSFRACFPKLYSSKGLNSNYEENKFPLFFETIVVHIDELVFANRIKRFFHCDH